MGNWRTRQHDVSSMYFYCDLYHLEVVDGCVTYDSLDRMMSSVDDRFASVIENNLCGTEKDDGGVPAEDVESALKRAHGGAYL